MTAEAVVTVVIPAYNGEDTLDETLRSVRGQTYGALDIVVVDDGSSDGTADIARRHAALDPRVRVIVQANGGVAKARNTGWQSSEAEFFAFVDADDLWTQDKIERQMEVMIREGAGLAYSWYLLIDGGSRIIGYGPPATQSGDVLDAIFESNFIGNGSSALVRRQALIDANGFESGLHQAGAQGCEDLMFYCRVAEKHGFAVVPDYLIGYRTLPNNMSSNLSRMLHSWMLVRQEMIGRHPDRAAHLDKGLRDYAQWLARQSIYLRRVEQFPKIIARLAEVDRRMAWGIALRTLPGLAIHYVKKLVYRTRLALRGQRPIEPRYPRGETRYFQIGGPVS